jgi:hypothetical protein
MPASNSGRAQRRAAIPGDAAHKVEVSKMISLKRALPSAAIAAAVGLSALAISAVPASAEVVCNGKGECWHVRQHYDYEPTLGLTVYDDVWYKAHRHDRQYHWRAEHAGRGYWRDGIWIRL